jgi:hypothetical protein
MTIDCNQSADAAIACGAVRVCGDHVRVRRVKCINWGNRTSGEFGMAGFVMCLVLPADNAGIEDCIAVQPSENNDVPSSTTLFYIGTNGTDLFAGLNGRWGQAPFIRNCFVDCGGPAATAGGYVACGMNLCKGGVVEGNHVYNTDTGAIYVQAESIIVRNNLFSNVVMGHGVLPGNINQGVKSFIAYGNHVELFASDTTDSPSAFVVLDQRLTHPPYMHGSIVFRNNAIRYSEVSPGPFLGSAFNIGGASTLVIQSNIIDLPAVSGSPVGVGTCAAVFYSDNRSSDGVLITGFNETEELPERITDTFEVPAEEALIPVSFTK